MLKNIVGQAGYQLVVMAALVFYGDAIFGIPAAASDPSGIANSLQYTLVFNTFVLMQLCNQISVRKTHDEPNILDGVLDNRLFLGILVGEALLQASFRC